MQSFRAPSVSLAVPDGWQDASTYIVTGPKVLGFRPSVVVAFTQGVLDPYLKRHVDIQAGEMQQKLAGFSLIQRSDTLQMPFGQAIIMEYTWTSPEVHMPLHQYQMYVLAGQSLYTLTATAPAAEWATLQATLLGIIRSFRPQSWPAAEPPVTP